jgi:hypothetical protein
MTTTTRARKTFAKLEAALGRNSLAVQKALHAYARGEASATLDAEYERLFYRGETLAARLLVVERYLPRAAA